MYEVDEFVTRKEVRAMTYGGDELDIPDDDVPESGDGDGDGSIVLDGDDDDGADEVDDD